jgi:integrase
MGVFVRDDSPFYYLWLERAGPGGTGIKEPTDIRRDAPLAVQRKENRALAEQRYHDRMTELARGATPGALAARTFAEQAAWFVTHTLPRRKGREREGPVITKLVAVFGRVPLAQITRTLVTEQWITPRLKTPTIIKKKKRTAGRRVYAGPRTVNREVAILKAVLQSAVPDYLEASPLYGMPELKTTTPDRRLMTEDEERRLLRVMAPDDKALFLLGEDSLIRLGDLLDLKRSDDRGDRMWVADPKAGGGFAPPISTRARQALDAWYQRRRLKPTDYLFPRRRVAKTERDRRNGVRQMLQRYCREADVPYGRAKGGITFHWATRRTGLTRMLTRGVDLGTAQKVGRWKTPDVVLTVYHELIDEAAHAAVNAVAGGKVEAHDRRGVSRVRGRARPQRSAARRPASR